MILLEDLHWFDGASNAYLETTVESVPATHDLLLVTFRPEYQAGWMQRWHRRTVEIESALERAEHLITSIEGRALSPRAMELRARLAAAVGDAPSSDRTRRAALDLYRAIGATGHAERLARELDV